MKPNASKPHQAGPGAYAVYPYGYDTTNLRQHRSGSSKALRLGMPLSPSLDAMHSRRAFARSNKLDEVAAVLDTLAKAAQAGELDKAIYAVTKAKAAKAAA